MEELLKGCFLLWTYGIAAIPFGLVITGIWGGEQDLREVGSGNIGATNVARTHGWRMALPVLVLDVSKGALPVWAAQLLWPGTPAGWPALVAITAFVGHCYPVYLEFRGGKGVATGAGALLALTPKPLLAAAAIWVGTLAWTGRSSVAALTAALSLVGLTILLAPADLGPVLLIAAGITFTHTANIQRLIQGEEKQVVRPVRWARQARLTAEEALAQGPSGQAAEPDPWPKADPTRQDEAKLR